MGLISKYKAIHAFIRLEDEVKREAVMIAQECHQWSLSSILCVFGRVR